MRHFFLFILLLCQIAALRAQRLVIIGLDGFSTEGYKAIKHPHIDELFKDGTVSLTTRPVMPSVTLPNWTSHLTGSGPEEHGVTTNDWTLTNHSLTPLIEDAEGYYPSIFKQLKEQIPAIKTAFYYNWAELINAFNKKYIDELSFQYNDGYDSNYNRALSFLKANKNHPQLIFLYSVHTDHAGHGFGWMSEQYIDAVEKADSAIGHFIDRIKKENLYEDTYFLLITDHGGINKGHGGTSMKEMQVPWAISGPGIRKQYSAPFFNSNKNTSLVLSHLFKLKKVPDSWTGVLPAMIFK